LPAVHAADRFWNAELSKLGSPFQLDKIIHVPGIFPVDDLRPFTDLLGSNPPRKKPDLPDSVRRLRGDVVIALSDGKFRSFTYGFPVPRKVLVGIENLQTHPLSMPNGALNVIAHELGHVIGLGHNNDGSSLMCGIETVWCHFSYPAEEVLLLTNEEKLKLLEMYPRSWEPDPPSRWKGDPVPISNAG